MTAVRIALAWMLVMRMVTPAIAQLSSETQQGGTYNLPAGAGAVPPALPANPFNTPPFGPSALTIPGNYTTRGLYSSNPWLWLQQFQPGQVRPGRAEPENRSTIKVFVPTTDTQLWVNGQLTRQKGRERVFVTPPLTPGTYRYRFRASWSAGKAPERAEQTVTFLPDTSLVIDFAKNQRPAP